MSKKLTLHDHLADRYKNLGQEPEDLVNGPNELAKNDNDKGKFKMENDRMKRRKKS